MTTLSPEIKSKLETIVRSARALRQSSVETRNKVLKLVSEKISQKADEILAANKKDLAALKPETTNAFRDRLTLTHERLKLMQQSLNDVQGLPDPLGAIAGERKLENGLVLKRVRSPLGVLLMIFEARPNVITEAFSLALKSGNALVMRGGSDSLESSRVIYSLIEDALKEAGLPPTVFWGVTDPDRALAQTLMKQNKYIDVLVPRGGDSLIEYVVQNATIPIIKNDRGLCHVYMHEDANEEMTVEIVFNAKTQRPGVCNSMETLLIHRSRIDSLPKIYDRLQAFNVEWFGCPETLKALKDKQQVQPVSETSFDTEYLDYKINCRVVGSIEEALEHIERHGSRHSESIVTQTEKTARLFQNSIDAAVVYWNASTRFTDGFEFGLGGELGISTQKLHVRGPVGLNELTSLRWIADGTGQVRR